LCLVWAAPPAFAEEQPWRRVDHVVAEVGQAVVTRSELESEARLALLRARGPQVARTVALGEPLLRSVLKSMAQRELLLAEARRLSIREASQEEVDQRVQALFAAFSSRSDALRFFERVGFSVPPELEPGRAPPGLVDQVRAEVQVIRFVELRVRPSVIVKPSDVEACYTVNRARFGAIPLEEARRTIEATLREAASDRALTAILTQLEKKTPVRTARGLELGPIAGASAPSVGLVCPEPKT